MSQETSDVIKAESCFIFSTNLCFVHDLFLRSYVVENKPLKDSLFVCTRIITGLSDEKREEQSNIVTDFFGEENSLWLRDFVLTSKCYLKLTIWNAESESAQKEKSNYICFEEATDNNDKSILFFVDNLLKKRVHPKFFVRHEEMK